MSDRYPTKAEVRGKIETTKKAKKIAAPPAPPEHPEDRAAREEGERYGAAHADEFAAENVRAFATLISTYADSEAEKLLFELREKFWACGWKPKAPTRSAT